MLPSNFDVVDSFNTIANAGDCGHGVIKRTVHMSSKIRALSLGDGWGGERGGKGGLVWEGMREGRGDREQPGGHTLFSIQ